MNIRLRKDLKPTKRQQGLETVWVLKDPVAFTHFQFSEQEYFLAKLFNGRRSVDQVAEAWQAKFRSASLSVDQINSFAQRLISDQLVVIEKSGHGHLLDRLDRKSKTGGAKWLTNPLAIRLRGINPTPILRELDWLGRVLFHPVVVVLMMILSALVLLFLLGNFEAIAERTPRIEQILSTRGVLGLLVTVAIVKIIHELGHALACRRFGAECVEIGVMFLALIPTLYCNVSDAWAIPERWKRMMVSFAGIYVEICLAAIAAIAWCLTPPGLLSALLFNVIVLCSLNTILINGNPLLRYDGYYLLSDWLEKPNLSQAAASELGNFGSRWIRKPSRSSDFGDGRSGPAELNIWLLFYAIAAFCYRWFVVGIIIYGLVCFASLWQARSLGLLVGGGLLLAMLWGPMKRSISKSNSSAASPLSLVRVGLTLVVLAGLLGFVALVPLPKTVSGSFEVRLKEPVPVFSPVDGKLVSVVEPYQKVEQGETIARLENPELQQKVELKRLELSRAENELELLNARASQVPTMASRISVAEKNVATVQASYLIFQDELKRTNLVAPQAGVVFPAPRRIPEAQTLDRAAQSNRTRLASGLLDSSNANCFVRSSEHLLTIADPESRKIIMFVDETDMDYVAVGQTVRLGLDRFPGRIFEGSVEQVFTDQSTQGSEQADDAEPAKRFLVSVGIKEIPEQAVAGSVGQAKIRVPSQSIGKRLRLMFERARSTKL